MLVWGEKITGIKDIESKVIFNVLTGTAYVVDGSGGMEPSNLSLVDTSGNLESFLM